MKRTIFCMVCASIWLVAGLISARAAVLYGPVTFERTKGRPHVEEGTFHAWPGPAIVTITNGTPDGDYRVTSAQIRMNGTRLFGPRDFGRRVGHLDAQVTVAELNTIAVELMGKKGGRMTVEVSGQDPTPEVTLEAEPDHVPWGDSTVLTWSSQRAVECEIDQGIGPVAPAGSLEVYPPGSTTYTITAFGPGGTATDSAHVDVTVPLPTVTIDTVPDSIAPGETATLQWSSEYAESCSIDQGIGEVALSGSMEVTPQDTSEYTITATGPGGTSVARATVTVAPATVPQPEGSFGAFYEDLIPQDATASYDPKRFAMITGTVSAVDGVSAPDVVVSIHGCPEYGTAYTDDQGLFALPVEGGGTMTVVFSREGRITSHRKVDVPWNDVAVVEPVTMLAEDTACTVVTFDGNPDTVATHQSSLVEDEFGPRSCTVVFTGDTHAFSVDESGNTIEELSTITARATEFPTEESMPAVLPPVSAYTYCVELSADGVERVRFDRPVITWVDNFMGFTVGEAVPVGYYDRDRAAWIPYDNGAVVRLLDTDDNGIVDALDADGDGGPDDLNGDGIFADEVKGLGDPLRYPPGAVFWRTAVSHFTPWDSNWPFRPPDDAVGPNPEFPPIVEVQKAEGMACKLTINSYAEERSRILHEDIPIPGTEFSLHYVSNRVPGYNLARPITVPVSGPSVPASLRGIEVWLGIASRYFLKQLPAAPDQVAEFLWNGTDCRGRTVTYATKARVDIGFVYDAVFLEAGDFPQAFEKYGSNVTYSQYTGTMTCWKHMDIPVIPTGVQSCAIAQGWDISAHHHMVPPDKSTLHKGDGSRVEHGVMLIDTVAGTPPEDPDSPFAYPSAIVSDASGNLYVADKGNHRVQKVDRWGVITTVAGTGTFGCSGDGGPATEAELMEPLGLALDGNGNLYIVDDRIKGIRKVDSDGIISTLTVIHATGDYEPDPVRYVGAPRDITTDSLGSLYIADFGGAKVVKVDSGGVITRIAGTGTGGFSGDGGPALDAQLQGPHDVWVTPDGDIYIADCYNNRIRKVGIDGIITTVAGTGVEGFSGDGGPALMAELSNPTSVITDREGNLYIADRGNHRIRKVNTVGTITTLAGSDIAGYGGDRGAAVSAELDSPIDVCQGPDNALYVVDDSNFTVRKVARPSPFERAVEEGFGQFLEESGVGHIVSDSGLHMSTFDIDTGKTLYTLVYDEEKRLIGIDDRSGNRTQIVRDGEGIPVAVVAPDGVTTGLTVNGRNHLTEIIHPDGSVYAFEYSMGGLLTAKVEPEGNRYENRFTDKGRLEEITDEEGGSWAFFHQNLSTGTVLSSVVTGENDYVRYYDVTDAEGIYHSRIETPTGESLYSRPADNLSASKVFPCGMSITSKEKVDTWFGTRYVARGEEKTPSDLLRVTETEKWCRDRDLDGFPDLMSRHVKINGKSFVMEHDVLQAEKRVISPEGRVVTAGYDPETLLTARLTVPGLHDTLWGYDSRGRITSLTTGTRQASFTYDSNGFLETVTDPEQHITSFDHDPVGRVTGIHNPDGRSILFDYDLNGNMTMLTTPTEVNHGFGYNAVNRTDEYVAPMSGTYRYVYDRDRRVRRVVFPSGDAIEYGYRDGRLVEILTPDDALDVTYQCGNTVGSISNGTDTVRYTHDGRLMTSEEVSGTLNHTTSFTYDNDFRLAGIGYAGGTHLYTYDDDGLLTGSGGFTIGQNTGNGLPETVSDGVMELARSFNGYGEVERETVDVSGLQVGLRETQRDADGRIIEKTETLQGVSTTNDYTYDAGGRLTTVTRDGVLIEEYRYGPAGARIFEMNADRGIAARSCAYSDEDHLLSAGDTVYAYDLDGFLESRTDETGVTAYEYSTRGELLGVTLPDGTLVEYEYDPLGRRAAKRVNGTTVEKYLWQGMTRLLAVYDGSNTLTMRFEYADGRMPCAMEKDGVRYYFVYDQVGSPIIVVNEAGNVVKRINYDSFGTIITDTAPAFTIPFGFAGGLHDPATGLIRFGCRDYDPDIGRWTAKDPILFAGGDTDLYGYCVNDPVNWVDPGGLLRGILIPIRRVIKSNMNWLDLVTTILAKGLRFPLSPYNILSYDYYNPRPAGVVDEDLLIYQHNKHTTATFPWELVDIKLETDIRPKICPCHNKF